jgi:membrane-bound lytic murein transglycosylase D
MRTTSLSFLLPVALLASARPSYAEPVGARDMDDALAETTQALEPAAVPDPALVPPDKIAVAPAPQNVAIEEAWADVPDEPPIAEEIDKDSADIEAVRKAEQQSHVQVGAEPTKPETAEGRIALIPELGMSLAQLQAEYDIPIDVNASVVAYIRFFQSSAARGHFVKWLGRSHRYLVKYRAILKEEGLPEDTVYLAMIESGFGNFAYSRAKASGPWQFIAGTGRLYGLKNDFWVDERRDPERSAHAAARYLKKLYEQTGDWRLAWAGYNAGVGRIFKAREKGYGEFWEMAAVPGKKVLREETKGYVPKLMAAAIISKHPAAFGFADDEIERQSWTEYEEVAVPSATLLTVIAKAAGVTERDIIDLNPELRRACTPPRAYRIKIPKETAETFAEAWPRVQPKIRLTFAGHVVRRGDTLSSIAHRYGVPVQGIVEMNGMKGVHRLRVGQELMIPRPIGSAAVAVHEPAPEPARAEPARAEPARARARTVSVAMRVPADRTRSTLRVKQGDTLWSISQKYGVQLTELCRWNGIKDPRRHKLIAGSQLVVYGSASERG